MLTVGWKSTAKMENLRISNPLKNLRGSKSAMNAGLKKGLLFTTIVRLMWCCGSNISTKASPKKRGREKRGFELDVPRHVRCPSSQLRGMEIKLLFGGYCCCGSRSCYSCPTRIQVWHCVEEKYYKSLLCSSWVPSKLMCNLLLSPPMWVLIWLFERMVS